MSMVRPATIKKKIVQFLFVQLFLTLISMPILISWGLPLSAMSIVGNFIFSPCLTIFIGLSALLFFTELLHIPNAAVAYALDHYSSLWLRVLRLGSSSWLVSLSKPSIIVLLLIPVLACAIIQLKKISTFKQTALLAALLGTSYSYLAFFNAPSSCQMAVPCGKETVFLCRYQQTTLLIDPGFIARNANIPSWVEHTLLKQLRKNVGKTTIDHLIFLQPSVRVFEAVTALCKSITVKNVYLPRWHGELKKNQWHHFFTMRDAITATNSKLHRISKQLIIVLGPDALVRITPQEKEIKTSSLCYQALHVHGHLGGEKIVFKSAHLIQGIRAL